MRLALVGDPIAHSRSPAIHNAALAACGIEGRYDARRTTPDQVAGIVEELRVGFLDGVNATMPLKRAIAEAADRADADVARVGVANTLHRVGRDVVAANTDVGGIRLAWQAAGLPDDAPVLLLGSGGAAAAALLALEGKKVRIHSRTPAAALSLIERLDVMAEFVEFPVGKAAVVVNATPVGMDGESLPDHVIEGAVGVLDMAYGDTITPLTRRARDGGLPVADGIEMLVWQASLSFTIWTGLEAPISVMRHAAVASEQ